MNDFCGRGPEKGLLELVLFPVIILEDIQRQWSTGLKGHIIVFVGLLINFMTILVT